MAVRYFTKELLEAANMQAILKGYQRTIDEERVRALDEAPRYPVTHVEGAGTGLVRCTLLLSEREEGVLDLEARIFDRLPEALMDEGNSFVVEAIDHGLTVLEIFGIDEQEAYRAPGDEEDVQ